MQAICSMEARVFAQKCPYLQELGCFHRKQQLKSYSRESKRNEGELMKLGINWTPAPHELNRTLNAQSMSDEA